MKQYDALREDGVTNANGAPLTMNLAYNTQAGNSDGISEADEVAIVERAEEMVRAGGYAIKGSHPGNGQYSGEMGMDAGDF